MGNRAEDNPDKMPDLSPNEPGLAQKDQQTLENQDKKEDYTDADGVIFEWDYAKKAYFPKINQDFIARYQMLYNDPEKIVSNNDTPESVSKSASYDLLLRGNKDLDHDIKIAQLENQINRKTMEKIESQFKEEVLGIEPDKKIPRIEEGQPECDSKDDNGTVNNLKLTKILTQTKTQLKSQK